MWLSVIFDAVAFGYCVGELDGRAFAQGHLYWSVCVGYSHRNIGQLDHCTKVDWHGGMLDLRDKVGRNAFFSGVTSKWHVRYIDIFIITTTFQRH